MAKASTAMPMMDKMWQAQSDVDTLTRAHEIKSDKSRHAAAQKHARKQMTSLGRVAGKRGRR